eukprot:3366165-Rhodomonas_salina.2
MTSRPRSSEFYVRSRDVTSVVVSSTFRVLTFGFGERSPGFLAVPSSLCKFRRRLGKRVITFLFIAIP